MSSLGPGLLSCPSYKPWCGNLGPLCHPLTRSWGSCSHVPASPVRALRELGGL